MALEFDELEEYVMAEMSSTYTETVIDHAMNPRNAGSMPNADGYASLIGPCGDTMKIWLRVTEVGVVNATFWTDGCGPSIACGSMATELVIGKSTAEAMQITQENILNSLGGLPEESLHCALLTAKTLKAALRDYIALKNEPWKRAYRSV